MLDERLLEDGNVNFCYCDESGTGEEPIALMVGILVDSGRMNLTKRDWAELLRLLRKATGRQIRELHTADFYSGNNVWRDLDGPVRAAVITEILNWLAERKHHVVYTSVRKSSYFGARKAGQIPEEVNTLWRFLASHLILAVQKYSQPEKSNKGNTFFWFDNQERETLRLPDLVLRPPEWSDEYYAYTPKSDRRLDQVVDVPAFGDSRDLPLLQVADFLAFFLRRYAEIQEGLPTAYAEEEGRIGGWIKQIRGRSIGRQHIYPKLKRTGCHDLFYRHAPPSIRDL